MSGSRRRGTLVVLWDAPPMCWLLVDKVSRRVIGKAHLCEDRRRAGVNAWEVWWEGMPDEDVVCDEHWQPSLNDAVEAMQRGWAAARRGYVRLEREEGGR